MINLQPLIEKFKKAVYGRDVRQSIVDLAQAIGDNHNEQETLREEVKTLNADTKEENKQGKEYITNKKTEMDKAITLGKATIKSTVSTGKAAVDSKVSEAVSTIENGKSELDTKINAGIGKLGAKTTEGEHALSEKTQSGISSLEQKTTESTQTVEAVISRASESKAAVDTAIIKAGESKTALESTIQQSESGKTTLDATIQQSTAKGQELEAHIAEINQIIADGKAVTKEQLNIFKKQLNIFKEQLSILKINADDYVWYINRKTVDFYGVETEANESTCVEAYCKIKLSEVKEKITRDGIKASLNISGWDPMLAHNIPCIIYGTQVFVNIAGLKATNPQTFCSELTDNGVKVYWTSPEGEITEKDAWIFVKLVLFY